MQMLMSNTADSENPGRDTHTYVMVFPVYPDTIQRRLLYRSEIIIYPNKFILTCRVIVNECYKNKQVTCNKYQYFLLSRA